MKGVLVELLWIVGLALIGLVDGLAPDKSITFQRETLGPGMYLVGVSVLLLAFSAVYFWSAWKSRDKKAAGAGLRPGAGLGMWAAMVGYAALVPLLGYSVSTFLFFAMVFLLLGVRPWWRTGVAGLVFAVVFYVAFVWLANVWLPAGWVGRLLEAVY